MELFSVAGRPRVKQIRIVFANDTLITQSSCVTSLL